LSCNNISSVQGGATTLLATIPVSATPFGMIDYKDVGNNLISISNTSLDDLDIEIIDGESGAYINFNNQDWCITLAIHITKSLEPLVKPTMRDLTKRTDGSPMTSPLEINPSVPLETKPIPSLQTSLQFLEQSKKPENKDLEELDLLTQ
jgi:predicted nucleic acid-binding OB-fold protein